MRPPLVCRSRILVRFSTRVQPMHATHKYTIEYVRTYNRCNFIYKIQTVKRISSESAVSGIERTCIATEGPLCGPPGVGRPSRTNTTRVSVLYTFVRYALICYTLIVYA